MDTDHQAHLCAISLSPNSNCQLDTGPTAETLACAREDLFMSTLSNGHVDSLSALSRDPNTVPSEVEKCNERESKGGDGTWQGRVILPSSSPLPSFKPKLIAHDTEILDNICLLITQCTGTLKQPASYALLDDAQSVIQKCQAAINGIHTSESLKHKREVTELLNKLTVQRLEILNVLPKCGPLFFSSGMIEQLHIDLKSDFLC